MERNATMLWILLLVAPVIYLATAVMVVTYGHQGLARDPAVIPNLFIGFLILSAVNAFVIYYTQTSARFKTRVTRISLSPESGAFQVLTLGMIISEALSIYGLILTLLSGSMLYGIGFSIGAWIGLVLVRIKFKQNMSQLPPK